MLWAQYLAHFSGGEVAASNTREYGRANLSYIKRMKFSLKVFQ
jgi:GMP synthase (glutamine-hydrolysing)